MKHFKTKIGLLIAVLTVGIFTVALAHDGSTSYGGHMMGPMMGYGMGYHGHMMDYDMGYDGHMGNCWTDGNNNLSLENSTKLKQAREEFLNKTRELRDSIEQKQLALNQELRKEVPDREKALNLQKELSKLDTEFSEKALAHQLDLRKTFPDVDLSYGYGLGGGYCW